MSSAETNERYHKEERRDIFTLLGIKKATVLTPTTICFNDDLTAVPFVGKWYKDVDAIRPLVVALLDAGIPVDTYWKKIDYTVIDPRLPKGYRV